jgi:thiol-disulfide isomerase/thioredoxin
MEFVTKQLEIEQVLQRNDMVIVYFSGQNCSVCKVLKPKVNELLNDYPNIKKLEVVVEDSLELSAQHNIFTVPSLLLFIEGKEVIREQRHMSLLDLEDKIARYYRLLY